MNYLPDGIIVKAQKAFDINIANARGCGTTYGTGGRLIDVMLRINF